MILVEAAVENRESALAAGRAGADRIELCANLNDGGTTPDAALIASVIAHTRLPVFVLVRNRRGGFVYTESERDAMTREICEAVDLGIAGIVTGALTHRGDIDTHYMRAALHASAELPITFHRAFDVAEDPSQALEQLIDLGVPRVLTSGGAATALEGADEIASLVDRSRNRISIVGGGGIREHNVRDLIARTGVSEIHSRLVDEEGMRALVDAVRRA